MSDTIVETNKKTNKIDLSQAIVMRFIKGYTYQEIADKFECKKESVYGKLQRFRDSLEDQEFRDKFDALEPTLCRLGKLEHLINITNPDTVKSSSANNSAYVVGQLNTVQALAEGKPTQIVDINQVNLEIKQIEARLKVEVKKELKVELSTDKHHLSTGSQSIDV